ncbi:hypothetical protein AB0K18_05225 [Nonomuraea sp. NPDC049421]|uniref:hypothetical protein n=1 Tax=Nonomuraea sp. NPDC049421 TaxID=3155275 RepID=UPI00344630C2
MARTGLLILVALLAAGCAGNAREPAPVDLGRVSYPLDAYDLTDAELETTIRARYLLTGRCAAKFGAVLPALPQGPRRVPYLDRYGLYDEATARKWGYRLGVPGVVAPPWEGMIDVGSPAYLVVNGTDGRGRPAGIDGLPAGGCRAAANRVLERGTPPDAGNPVPRLDRQGWEIAQRHPAVLKAADAWKSCMAKAGHRLENPVKAPYVHWSRARDGNPHPTAAERRAALDDIRCKNVSGFVRASVDAELAAQRTLAARHLDLLERHRRRLDRIVRNAADVVAAGQGQGERKATSGK